jgi:outer membrane protein OmpA-like peptidoglycan-associated protein
LIELRTFDGDVGPFSKTSSLLQRLLSEREDDKEDKQKSRKGIFWLLFSLFIIVGLSFFIYRHYFHKPVLQPPQSSINISAIREKLAESDLDYTGITFEQQDNILILHGHVPAERDKLLLGKTVAQALPAGMILNNITFDHTFETALLQTQLQNSVLRFPHNSTVLTAETKNVLDELIPKLSGWPGVSVYISGHSDIQGEETVNEKIALKRAIRVRDYLVAAGLDSNRFITRSWGAKKPVAGNQTEEGRAQNRRVEFSLSDE